MLKRHKKCDSCGLKFSKGWLKIISNYFDKRSRSPIHQVSKLWQLIICNKCSRYGAPDIYLTKTKMQCAYCGVRWWSLAVPEYPRLTILMTCCDKDECLKKYCENEKVVWSLPCVPMKGYKSE